MPLPISDITNPDVIKFLIENYEKTAQLRMNWNHLYGARMAQAATLQREEKGYVESDVLKAAIEFGMPAIAREHINAQRTRRSQAVRDAVFIPGVAHLRKGHSITDVGLGDVKDDPRLGRPDTDLALDPVMRPIDPVQREILYKEIPFYGREVYLKSRSKIPPEKRFYMRETAGAKYGWRLTDSYFSKHQPEYGRVWRLTHQDTRSKTGPQPDPPHYKSGDAPGVSKCVL